MRPRKKERFGKVPRKPKILPANRADFTYGDLVYWHLFRYGTRPSGDPSATIGRPWSIRRAAGEIKVEEHTIRNWMNGKRLPNNSGPLARAIFGENPKWEKARAELEEKLVAGWLLRNKKADDATAPATNTAESANADSNDEADDIAREDKELDAGDAEEKESASERSPAALILYGDDTGTSSIGSEPVAESAPAEGKGTTRPRVTPLSALVTSIALLLAAFVWQRLPSRPAEPPAKPSTETTKDEPHSVATPAEIAGQNHPALRPKEALPAPVAAPPTPPPPPQLTEEEKRAAEDKRIALAAVEARKVAYDAAARQSTIDAARRDQDEQARQRTQRDRGADARNVAGTGFSLRGNTSIAGQSIGYVLSETVADCAVACLRDNECDGFSYFRDQPASPLRKGRTCYRYKAPLTFSAHGSYTSGIRMPDGTRDFAAPTAAATTADPPVRFASNTKCAPY
jgi:hypothetical protein